MISRDGVHQALGDVRPILQADGADLELMDVDDGVGEVHLRLRLEDVMCEECVVPIDLLQSIALDAIRNHEPAVRAVAIDDPRSAP